MGGLEISQELASPRNAKRERLQNTGGAPLGLIVFPHCRLVLSHQLQLCINVAGRKAKVSGPARHLISANLESFGCDRFVCARYVQRGNLIRKAALVEAQVTSDNFR